jgi:hypothetical protein
LCGFVSATVWAGVNATHCPIACPNRQLPPERYATVAQNYETKKCEIVVFYLIIC